MSLQDQHVCSVCLGATVKDPIIHCSRFGGSFAGECKINKEFQQREKETYVWKPISPRNICKNGSIKSKL